MAYIYLHPGNLQIYINSLNDYAQLYSEQLMGVRGVNRSEGDPADVPLDISEISLMSTYSGKPRTRADDLQKRLEVAVEMNTSGVTPPNGEMVAYYLPDEGQYSQDTMSNVISFNTLAAEGVSAMPWHWTRPSPARTGSPRTDAPWTRFLMSRRGTRTCPRTR